jgi:phosphatidylglycerophosphate synthase
LFSALLFYAFCALITGVGFWRSYVHSALGLCNLVTLLRLVLVGVLFAALVSGLPPRCAIFGLALVALSLDGVDGYLARRQNLTSTFGARFDMETDAVFALVLALLALNQGTAGALVLVLALPSYLFFLAKFVFPWLDNTLPDLFSRKAVCVAQLGVLIGLQLPFLKAHQLDMFIVAVAAALVWSFGRDIAWLWKRRA